MGGERQRARARERERDVEEKLSSSYHRQDNFLETCDVGYFWLTIQPKTASKSAMLNKLGEVNLL
jgi:hypothetical protein